MTPRIAIALALCGAASISCASGQSVESSESRAHSLDVVRAISGDSVRPSELYGAFPEQVTRGKQKLELNGAGLCEYGFFGVDLYRCALYLPKPERDATKILRGDQPWLLTLHFVRELTQDQLRMAYDASVRAAVGDQLGSYEKPLEQLLGAMEDVGEGDSLTFEASPEAGLVVLKNKERKATIKDDAFRKLFLELYLGRNPPDENMKKDLIGGGR